MDNYPNSAKKKNKAVASPEISEWQDPGDYTGDLINTSKKENFLDIDSEFNVKSKD